MIRALFQGRLDYERARKNGGVPAGVTDAIASLRGVLQSLSPDSAQSVAEAGFRLPGVTASNSPDPQAAAYWFDARPSTPSKQRVHAAIAAITQVADAKRHALSAEERRIADYMLITQEGFPAYLGGAFGS